MARRQTVDEIASEIRSLTYDLEDAQNPGSEAIGLITEFATEHAPEGRPGFCFFCDSYMGESGQSPEAHLSSCVWRRAHKFLDPNP